MLINLTKDERERFAAYCQLEAESYDGMAKQMEKLPNMEPMVKHQRQFAIAFAVVAKHLFSQEEQTIGG